MHAYTYTYRTNVYNSMPHAQKKEHNLLTVGVYRGTDTQAKQGRGMSISLFYLFIFLPHIHTRTYACMNVRIDTSLSSALYFVSTRVKAYIFPKEVREEYSEKYQKKYT